MNLTDRPWSLNSFAMSKVWFRCHTVDLRIVDVTNLTSKVNTSLAAPGALAHRLQRRTACNTSPPALSKMADRVPK